MFVRDLGMEDTKAHLLKLLVSNPGIVPRVAYLLV